MRRLLAAALLLACTAKTRPEEAPPEPSAPPGTTGPALTVEDLGLVGSRADAYHLADDQETLLRTIDSALQPCTERHAERPTMWQALYTIPGLGIPWRRHVVTGGPAAKRCMEDLLSKVAWPQGWSGRVEELHIEDDPPPEDRRLAEVHTLSARLQQCPRGGPGDVELDVAIDDEHGSTAMNLFMRGTARSEECFRVTLRAYVLPHGWKSEISLKRDGVPVPLDPAGKPPSP